jgi:hypothetical protein
MQWFRNWLTARATRPAKPACSNAFRPNLESLDQRDVPSVSSVLTKAFGDVQFVVTTNNTL